MATIVRENSIDSSPFSCLLCLPCSSSQFLVQPPRIQGRVHGQLSTQKRKYPRYIFQVLILFCNFVESQSIIFMTILKIVILLWSFNF